MASVQVQKCIVLGVTGGIAAYKACEVASRLVKGGFSVYTIMTENATKLVAPLTFQTLTKHPVVTDTFAPPVTFEVEHIALAQRADLFLIAPATANILAKLAHGIADDMLSTTALATRAPLLLAPAMNTGMWDNAATQANVRLLKDRGARFVGPEGGLLACGDSGMGRMSEPADIFQAAQELLNARSDLSGLRVLVTAGPTREAMDPVRFLTNRSSGKMGYAIADAAKRRGAEVTLVSGPVALSAPAGVQVLPISSTEDLLSVMLEQAPQHDIIIQAAAPADFRPVSVAENKIKKGSDDTLTVSFTQTPDVAKAVGQQKRKGQTLVGFAAETELVLEHALQKLDAKRLDLIVANDVTQPGAGFDVDTNIITLIDHARQETLPLMSKRDAANAILDRVLALRQTGGR
ncbi:MAG: bifunctional phosphopantothenoylcysteine decarboxylase/phosphopantothenate--cysteine ligase CoaBC [Clostridia bacterium]|nr:bifunctional phosphopantothenoylcysteine decarboxylase/phosphopantothenate--cysteine ligase CoaBC [Clostridia bacterium]